MRFHIPSIPHTVTSKEHSACAFTQNIVNFCAMMSRRGHEIIHYGHRHSKVECAELVTVIEPETYDLLYGNVYDIRKNQYTTLSDDSELYSLISGNTIYEISKRKQPGDFLLIFGGFWNKKIADAHQDMIIVEPAIGYPSSFCNYKVYPSYAYMHSFVQNANVQMNSYHVVIPHYFDVDDFDATQPKEDYFLFVGRLNFDKGITLAIHLTSQIGARLKVCGQGNLASLGYDKIPDHVDFIGYVGVEERKKLMARAKCLIMPTLYMEPFGCVAIEGMLSGTPILTNEWGGPGENNVHGVTGFKCRTFEQYVWAAQNIHLISPKNCREWAEKNFSFDKIGHMYEDYLQSLQGGLNWYKPNPSRTNLDHLTKHYPKTVTRKIPYNLFQTFKTKDISPPLQTFVDTWKEKNPEYTYNFYDDQMCDKFMKEFDIRTWKAYRRIVPGAFKADLWRYCVLYKYGGVYADIDTRCLGKIDYFLNETTEFVTPIDLDDILLYNTFIASAPGSKVLKDCIDTIVHNVENNIIPEDKIYFAGPGVLANCMNEFLGRDKQTSFAGQMGWHGTTHLLKFEPVNQHVKDEKGNVLLQNKEKHGELFEAYHHELRRFNLTPWFYCKDVLRAYADPLTVYRWDNKVRLGINTDGGYVIADGLTPYDLYISAGVSSEESFTRDFINKYAMNETNSFAFDGTIDKYPYEYTSDISFIRKNISTVNDTRNTNLDNLLSRHKDAFLKMDIEAHEWRWLSYTPYLKNIKQMVVEFHGVWDASWSGNTNSLPPGFTHECFEKLSETHAIVHVHGNTGGGLVNGLPNVIELTYIRRDSHALEKNTCSFPVKGLDFPNMTSHSDFSLKPQPFS